MNTITYRTKPGTHGTLYRYSIEYTDHDPAFGKERWSCWAYSEDHALEKFHENDEDFVPLRIARQKMNGAEFTRPETWKWHKI